MELFYLIKSKNQASGASFPLSWLLELGKASGLTSFEGKKLIFLDINARSMHIYAEENNNHY